MFFFFFNDTATTEIYTLSLHDALPISRRAGLGLRGGGSSAGVDEPARHRHDVAGGGVRRGRAGGAGAGRSEEHTAELQSRLHLACRLLLRKKKSRQPPSQLAGRYRRGP